MSSDAGRHASRQWSSPEDFDSGASFFRGLTLQGRDEEGEEETGGDQLFMGMSPIR